MLWGLRFREQWNTNHCGCETLFENFDPGPLMVNVQFYIKFGLFFPSSNFDYKTHGVYFSLILILRIRSKVFSHREPFVCWLFFHAAKGI